MRSTTVYLSVIAMILLVGAGCEKKTAQQPTVTPPNLQLGVAENITKDGLDPQFPKDIPILPGATIVESSLYSGTASVTLVSTKSQKDIIAWYTNVLNKDGWKEQMNQQTGTGMIVTYMNGVYSALLTVDTNPDTAVGGMRVGFMRSHPE
ncbi:MAG TPA: hypothetical protein VEA18_01600 [Candidatus Kapabacteria bacterium]|nr:hypothetical protein [Candidatus Kapabacteria bacterium]